MSEQHDQIVFEDKNEHHGFTQIPNVVLTSTVLSPTAVRIYGILRRYASMEKGAMPSVPTICVEANISKATYNREVKTFIRSTENPNPAVPLITAIHRRNKTNVFKIHKITDQLISKLKPTITMKKTELESLKEKYKKKSKKKSGSQIETPIENTRVSQNETYQGGSQIETPGVSNCDTSNIENKQYRQTNGDCLISKTEPEANEFINYAFRKEMDVKSIQATKDRYLEARQAGIDHETLMNALKEAFQRHGKATSPVSVVKVVIDNHLAAKEAEKMAEAEKTKKEELRKENDERVKAALVAAGINPEEVGY